MPLRPQGLSHLAINGLVLGVLYYGGNLVAADHLNQGQLLSILMHAQTIQRSLGSLRCARAASGHGAKWWIGIGRAAPGRHVGQGAATGSERVSTSRPAC